MATNRRSNDGLILRSALIVVVVVVTVKLVGGLRTQERRWYARAQLLGWMIVGDTVFYIGSIVVGLWFVDGPTLVADNALFLAVFVVLHLPVLWLGGRIVLLARRLLAGVSTLS